MKTIKEASDSGAGSEDTSRISATDRTRPGSNDKYRTLADGNASWDVFSWRCTGKHASTERFISVPSSNKAKATEVIQTNVGSSLNEILPRNLLDYNYCYFCD